ncbi:TPA: restriction endonuclease subunit S [Staphylococcus aureus]|nr:restriction endonuclease subunit S [Staphylococcus aureus]HCY4686263.1 restriction endonuclease subunit S [Staphylococcus aureus]HCY4697360.1 restriction endonuclease subunit S [Staphylococcus aureus]HCY4743054.1 restriction endonuclease subunit S [Staphylococcus aureus]
MSNTQKKNVPELRFPGFEGEWEEKKLRELRNPNDKYSYTGGPFGSDLKKSDYTTEGIQIIQLQNIGDGYFYNRNRVFTSYEKAESLKSCNIFPGDIVIAKMADPIARAAIVPNNNGKYLMASDGIRLSVDTLNFNTKFILECINRKSFRKKVEDNSSGSTRMRIGLSTLGNLTIKTTTLNEQQRIAEFLSKLDRQIELEEQKLELLQQQKKGYMQKIFSQELRFKDENGNDYPDWEEKQLGEVAEIIGGGTPSTKNKLYWNGEINWFSPIEIGNKTYVYSSQKKITEEGLRKSSAKILPVGTILFTSRAGIGKTAILAKESTTNQGFQSIVPRKGLLDSYYVYTISNILKILAEKVGAGSTFSEISKKQMEQLNLNIPMIKEQKNISKFFSKFDNLIEIHERKLEFLKQRKQSLLQKMFV